jgi:hypothetical protein
MVVFLLSVLGFGIVLGAAVLIAILVIGSIIDRLD